ncbi:MAG: PfkB family carbohydrate kinase [Nocardioidaceae bacterium]
MPRLVHTGGVVVDVVLAVPALPEPGADLLAQSSIVTAGGGFTVLAAARRQGLAAVLAGRVGTGPFGSLVTAALDREGIRLLHPPVPDQDTGCCVVLVDADAERTLVTASGAEAGLAAADLARVEVHDDDWVHVSGYGLAPEARGAPLAAWVRGLRAGPRVVLDVSPLVADLDRALLARVAARVDVLTCNRREADLMTGLSDPTAAAAALQHRLPGDAVVVVRSGRAGAYLAEPGAQVRHVPAPQVVAVDSNGAGDTHTGVLVAALAAGLPPQRAVARANAAAALSVTRHGPATCPTSAEVEELMARHTGASGGPPRSARPTDPTEDA